MMRLLTSYFFHRLALKQSALREERRTECLPSAVCRLPFRTCKACDARCAMLCALLCLTGCGGDMPTGPTGPNHNEGDLVVELPGGAKMAFIRIEPGIFMMGAGPGEAGDFAARLHEYPQHQVTLTKGFYIGKYEVTQGQWESVMDTRPWEEDGGQSDKDYPATNMSWWAWANKFIGKLNEAAGDDLYRLPTEAEWEYACRAGSTTAWSFGEQNFPYKMLLDHAWHSANSEGSIHKVGTKLPNPWGLYDMHGNVAEWVFDLYSQYPDEPQIDPVVPPPDWWPAGRDPLRIYRSGSYSDDGSKTRSASRAVMGGHFYDLTIGCRVVRGAR